MHTTAVGSKYPDFLLDGSSVGGIFDFTMGNKMKLRLISVVMAGVLAGCGGDGGNSGRGVEDPVVSVNQPPVLTSPSAETSNGEPVSVDLSEYASDPDGDSISIKSLSEPENGSVSQAGLVVTYDPEDSFAGIEVLNVTLTDGTDDVSGSITFTSYQGVSLSGQVVDDPIPNANVKVEIGGQIFEATADSEGHYTLDIESSDLDSYIKVTATGEEGAGVELVSLLGEIGSVLEAAGEDRELGGAGDTSTNVTNVSTARYVLAVEANEGAEITSDEEMAASEKSIDADKLLEIAAVIKVVLDNPDYDLPEGSTSVLELVTDTDAYNNFVAEVTSADPENNALTEAMEQIVSDPALTQAFSQESLASAYYTVDPAAPGFISRGGELLELNPDGTGQIVNEQSAATFTWSIGNGKVSIVFDEPLIDTNYPSAYDVLDVQQADEWVALTGSAQIEETRSEKSLELTLLVDGGLIDTVSHLSTYDATYNMGDTGIPAPNQVDATQRGESLFRDADASEPMAIEEADLADQWATYSFYQFETAYSGTVSSFAGDIFEFSTGGAGSALISGRDFAWTLENNTVTLKFSDGSVQSIQKIDGVGELSAFAMRTLDDQGSLVAFTYDFGTWQDDADALSAAGIVTEQGRHWATFVNGWYAGCWENGVYDLINCSGFGWEFNADSTANNLWYSYDVFDNDGDGNTTEVLVNSNPASWNLRADGVLDIERCVVWGDGSQSCFQREWLGLQASEGEIIVMEREFDGGAVRVKPRVNIYRDAAIPGMDTTAAASRVVVYPTVE
ncbi:Ig-like domain-containing protein [Microbulbifer yueqingensis]|uniref:Ig-like domain-containing protein n=1 Tax=Microbulbifer yueqingensis TaxID=658219 RepID=UPI0011134EC2|nr:Ig-like domain-containing protein [Microbulbifer yueqingensis]